MAELGAHAAGAPQSARARAVRLALIAGGVAAVAGIAIGALAAVLSSRAGSPTTATPISSVATWAVGARPAPDFSLVDQRGKPFTLRSLRGRSVIVTFIDPLCRSLCPLEARTLMQAVERVPPAARPTIVSVSVNPWGNSPATFREDSSHWGLDHRWRWGVGDRRTLARVWREYEIGVQFATRKLGGVTVHDVAHTEASYVVDRSGHERALFLYPFRAADVAAALRRLSSA